MRCPSCKNPLVTASKLRRYQSLNEHVCSPNAPSPLRKVYVCNNTCCIYYSPEIVLFWDHEGSFYGWNLALPEYSAALNSPAKKIEVEIYKKDENKIIFEYKGFRFKREYSYKSNNDGEILKRTSYVSFICNNIVMGRGRNMLFSFLNGVYSSIYKKGCFWDKTENDRKNRIQENKFWLIENFQKALS